MDEKLNREIGIGQPHRFKYLPSDMFEGRYAFAKGLEALFEELVKYQDTGRALKKYGLNPIECRIILGLFFDGETFKEIAKKEGFTSRQTLGYFYRIIIKKLKQAKFKLRKRHTV